MTGDDRLRQTQDAEGMDTVSEQVWINYDGEGISRVADWSWRLPVAGETVTIEGRKATVGRVEFELSPNRMVTLHLATEDPS